MTGATSGDGSGGTDSESTNHDSDAGVLASAPPDPPTGPPTNDVSFQEKQSRVRKFGPWSISELHPGGTFQDSVQTATDTQTKENRGFAAGESSTFLV